MTNSMQLELQLSNFELSKRFRDLGVTYQTYWVWGYYPGFDLPNLVSRTDAEQDTEWRIIAPAFTVAELGEMFPVVIEANGWDARIESGKSTMESGWVCYAREMRSPWNAYYQQRELTEADARAKMLIYLIEKGLVKPS